MKSHPNDLTRREFVRRACCAAVGSTGLLSALAQLRVMGAVAANASSLPSGTSATLPSDYKALVCLFLQGGNDANNMLVPGGGQAYRNYAAVRAELALPSLSLLPITTRQYSDGRNYALHPSMPEMQALYQQGKLAFLANVGTLVQPTTLAQYEAGVGLPPQLFSHYDQATQWQSSIPDQPFTTGWGGRLADLVNALNTNSRISMSISLAGTNSFQVGNAVSSFAVDPNGVQLLWDANPDPDAPEWERYTRQKAILGKPPANLLGAAFANTTSLAVTESEILRKTLLTAPALNTVFPASDMGDQLAAVAKLISTAPRLGLRRQIFFVQLGGWDLHAQQYISHGPLLAEISAAVNAFYNATVELGVENQVTTFTASDFGRTYVPNAGGTDHGWGNHQFILGGAVSGGDIYGAMPSLVVGADDDTGRGRWIPSTSVDEYNATLATWFGVSATDLPVVLPNIGRFAKPNLGFMG
ncbi:MAG TPA: DUF1501 domain-containing protein [Opitutus sp.]|nr:DUF1501 domain-containing protein [Opitutus sp.]